MSIPPHTPSFPILGGLADHAASTSDTTELENEVVGLFDRMRGRMLRYILGFGLSMADAEEVGQDVFLALYQHLVRGKPRAGLGAWVFQVAHNLSLKRRLAMSRMPSNPMTAGAERDSVQVVDPAPNPEDRLVFEQRQDRLQSVVRALPETDRQCLYLRAEGLRYREISGVLGISVGGVANSLARSLARLSAVDERRR
jgi:RNA polymerase sigma-70 factor (ECF subfamily)